ncbi:MAG: anthranilate phosphoribosyltransferase [Burkholderiales bacterium]|nr:anthranilate phosphoribosyltransferase [Burkholderiales bacterium]
MDAQTALNTLLDRNDLGREDMLSVMRQIMSGALTPAQIAGILIALRCKGETVAELSAAAEVMRALSVKVDLSAVEVSAAENLVDTCGTGGDAACTFNISTAAALVAAAAGCRVAKHGGRSVSSTCGSADVLEALGVNIDLRPEEVAQSIAEIGVGFMFAPNHHSAMRFAAPVRRELGVRTLFNLLGPMTNPAGAKNQVIGVFQRGLTAKLANVLKELGSSHVLVVHGRDGLDEISISGATDIAELKDGNITEFVFDPAHFGVQQAALSALRVANREEAKAMLLAALSDRANRANPARDIVALNAGAAIYVSGVAATLEQGFEIAQQAIQSGAAAARLQQLVEFSARCKSSAPNKP